jgi:hypothetical protein
MTDVRCGANIACAVCSARSFAAEWGLPPELETFDLRKGDDGLWRCSKHRQVKVVEATSHADKKLSARLADARCVETALIELFDLVDGEDRAEAGQLLEEARGALGRRAPA